MAESTWAKLPEVCQIVLLACNFCIHKYAATFGNCRLDYVLLAHFVWTRKN